MDNRKLKQGQIIVTSQDIFDEENTYILISSTKQTIFACNPKTHEFVSMDRQITLCNLADQVWFIRTPDEL